MASTFNVFQFIYLSLRFFLMWAIFKVFIKFVTLLCREPAYCILSAYCILHIAYWVQHFPQHHLSGSGIAQLEFYHCRQPVWGTLPMTKVMRKEAQHTQRRDWASGVPLEILEHIPPKPESAYFLLCAFTYNSDFTGGCPPLPLSEKRVSLQLQLIIPGCDSVSTYKLLWKSSSLPE